MPITREFSYETWQDTGTIGLKPLWFDNADPTDGRGVAHDLLEHFRTQTSVLEGESEAIGSLLYLRIASGAYWEQNPHGTDATRIVCAEVQTMVRGAVHDRLRLPLPIPSRRLEDEDIEQAITEGVNRAFSDVHALMEECGLDDPEDMAPYTESATRLAFIAWLRRGYRRAKRRYAGCDAYTLGTYLFKRIDESVNRLLRSELLYEGARVRVSVCPRRADVSIKVLDPDYDRWVDAELFC
ncbi:hypothetical protein D3C71_18780 [compost metagenome]